MKIAAGIDAGMDYTKVVILKEDGTYTWRVRENGLAPTFEVVDWALQEGIFELGISKADLTYVTVTGVGQEDIGFSAKVQPSFFCMAKGADYLCPGITSVVDMGSRKTLALCCNDGVVQKSAASEKCASGAGAYLNMVSSFLDMSLDEMNRLYFETDQEVVLETKCAVFAESEIISLIHQKVPVEAIVRGAFKGLAHRIRAQMLGLPIGESICAIGGVAMLSAALDALKNVMQKNVTTLEEPRIAGALGAALLALKQEGGITL